MVEEGRGGQRRADEGRVTEEWQSGRGVAEWRRSGRAAEWQSGRVAEWQRRAEEGRGVVVVVGAVVVGVAIEV